MVINAGTISAVCLIIIAIAVVIATFSGWNAI